ncbi:hypothetical protein AB0H43_34000 [Hamadaea sp. NPDC050747]|uniref:hypothetical protein n=1 Tax=Hamadaea sp. NPDC050747 TaxID=3155789 RepID=UPI0033CE0BD9
MGAAVNVFVDGVVEVHDHEPVSDSDEFDHVAGASLRCASGRLVVMGCTDYEPDADRIAVPVGPLRLRASRCNLDAAWAAEHAPAPRSSSNGSQPEASLVTDCGVSTLDAREPA